MSLNEEWINSMSALIRKRDHARTMVQRWQEKLDQTEQEIMSLDSTAAPAPEPAPEPEPAPVPE